MFHFDTTHPSGSISPRSSAEVARRLAECDAEAARAAASQAAHEAAAAKENAARAVLMTQGRANLGRLVLGCIGAYFCN